MSVWQRHPRLLTYSCLGATKLMPPALNFGSGAPRGMRGYIFVLEGHTA